MEMVDFSCNHLLPDLIEITDHDIEIHNHMELRSRLYLA